MPHSDHDFDHADHHMHHPDQQKAGNAPDPLAVPPRDPSVWTQVNDWLQAGLIGPSVIRGTSPQSYNRAHEFDLGDPIPDAFRYWHVEDLLEQMAALLDRALALRSEWQEKLAKAFTVESELLQFVAADKIYVNEVSAGLYEVPHVEAAQDAEAARQTAEAQQKVVTQHESIASTFLSSSRLEAQIKAESAAAWVGAFSTYTEGDSQNLVEIPYGGETTNKPQHLHNAAATRTRWEVYGHEAAAKAESLAQQGALGAAKAKQTAASRRSAWEALNKTYKQQRADIARNAAEQKAAAFTTTGGALNFRDQMDGLQLRIARDANDAFSRMAAASTGLQQIYGYAVPAPAEVDRSLRNKRADHHTLEAALVWVRDALAWLTRFRQFDQGYVLPISLRSLTGAGWQTGLTSGNWQLNIPMTLFEGQSHVRLRGMRAFAYGLGPDSGYWRLEVTPPPQGTVRHRSAANVTLDQSLLPRILLPRTGDRRHMDDVELVGVTALHNASPIGQWTIKMSELSTQGIPRSAVTDLELEFSITEQSAW